MLTRTEAGRERGLEPVGVDQPVAGLVGTGGGAGALLAFDEAVALEGAEGGPDGAAAHPVLQHQLAVVGQAVEAELAGQ